MNWWTWREWVGLPSMTLTGVGLVWFMATLYNNKPPTKKAYILMAVGFLGLLATLVGMLLQTAFVKQVGRGIFRIAHGGAPIEGFSTIVLMTVAPLSTFLYGIVVRFKAPSMIGRWNYVIIGLGLFLIILALRAFYIMGAD